MRLCGDDQIPLPGRFQTASTVVSQVNRTTSPSALSSAVRLPPSPALLPLTSPATDRRKLTTSTLTHRSHGAAGTPPTALPDPLNLRTTWALRCPTRGWRPHPARRFVPRRPLTCHHLPHRGGSRRPHLMSKAHRDPTASTKAPTASSTASTGRRSRPSSSPAPSTSATVEGAGRARGRGVRYNWVLGAVVPDDAGSTSSASSSPPLPPARSNGRPASARSASPALPPEDASCAAGRDQEEPEQGKKRKRRSKKAQNNAGAAAPPLALPSSSSPSPAPFSAAAAPLTSSRSTLPSVVLPTNRGTLVTIGPLLGGLPCSSLPLLRPPSPCALSVSF